MLLFETLVAALPESEDRDFMLRLWQRHHPYMFLIARRYTRQTAALEDIVSDSCLCLMERVDTLKPLAEGQLMRYISKTVRSRAIDHLRKNARESALPDDFTIATEEPFWHRIELRAELELLHAAVDGLPEPQRTAVRLRYGEGLTGAALAARLGVAESTARKYLAGAKRKLRAEVYADGEEEWLE